MDLSIFVLMSPFQVKGFMADVFIFTVFCIEISASDSINADPNQMLHYAASKMAVH